MASQIARLEALEARMDAFEVREATESRERKRKLSDYEERIKSVEQGLFRVFPTSLESASILKKATTLVGDRLGGAPSNHNEDVLQVIFSNLQSIEDLVAVSKTCTLWYKASRNPLVVRSVVDRVAEETLAPFPTDLARFRRSHNFAWNRIVEIREIRRKNQADAVELEANFEKTRSDVLVNYSLATTFFVISVAVLR